MFPVHSRRRYLQGWLSILACLWFAPARAQFTVDTTDREEVRNFFNGIFPASENVPMDWTGNTGSGNAGTTSQAFKDSVILRVNFFRAMAGVPTGVTLNSTFSAKNQKAALMMSANNTLNHIPPPSFAFFTAEGAEAASKSNLSLGSSGPDAIVGYMEDSGSNNTAVGHRRWILFPQTEQMGTGDVPKSGGFSSANALWVLDGNFSDPRPSTRDDFVAWPPPGFVPYQIVYPRWSISYPGANFSAASVTMTQGINSIPVQVLTPSGSGSVGENTLVWVPDNIDADSSFLWPKPTVDTPISVTVSGVSGSGVATSFSYTVTVFDPLEPGVGTVIPAVSGTAFPTFGQANLYTITPVPGATDYEWELSAISDYTLVEGAEDGLVNMTAITASSYNPVVTGTKASGAASFHLAMPDFSDQSLTINRIIVPQVGSQLQFKSRLGFATSSQVARAQVSTDGNNWKDLFSQDGTGTSGEATFNLRTASLSDYAGMGVQIRFLYDYIGGFIFPQTSSGVGWYIDSIEITQAEELTVRDSNTVSAASFNFTPSEAGEFALRARAIIFDEFSLDWGPILPVTIYRPTISLVTIASNYTDPEWAGSGDVITLSFTADQAIQTPSVIIAGRPATILNPSGDNWTATITVTSNDPEDAVEFTINFINLMGNTGSPISTTTNASSVSIDTTGPVIAVPGSQFADSGIGVNAVVNFTVSSTDNYTSNPIINAVPPSGSTFALGQTIVTVTSTDEVGNSSVETFTVNVQTLVPDTVLPTVAIQSPKSGAKFTDSTGTTVQVSGIANDNEEIASVMVSLNGGPFFPATLTPATTGVTWTRTVSPDNGVNVVVVKSYDLRANESTATLSFMLVNNRSDVVGSFNGLISHTGLSITPGDHVGNITLKVASTGAFTGKLLLGGGSKPLALTGSMGNDGTARFGKTGSTSLSIARTGMVTVSLAMTLDMDSPGTDKITGTLQESGVGIVATVNADRALYTSKSNPVSPLMNVPETLLNPSADQGKYTVLIQSKTPAQQGMAAGTFPQGDGWALLTISRTGVAKAKGKLADGTAFTCSKPLSKVNEWPFYVTLYKGKGSISGVIAFADNVTSDAVGPDLRWFKPANVTDKNYRDGWPDGIDVDGFASKYVPPVAGSGDNALLILPAALPTTVNAAISLSDGLLSSPLSNVVSVSMASKVTDLGVGISAASNLKLTITTATGALKGSFTHPVSTMATPFTGVIFQKQSIGSGYFLGAPAPGSPLTDTPESGAVGIE